MKWFVMIAVLLLGLGGFSWWFFSQPGPKQLDMVNDVIPGDSNAKLLVHDQIFDKQLGLGLNIWTPDSAATKPLPVIVFIYGGGWRDGAKDQYAFTGRALANRG
ncbi:carboxylesterase family protein, partial [Parasphingorhabdus sp.]|uniref:carboxylesterase family protein n=1 Tax=Parasphingorhabdus sp. TaxID=2709688 RepID=UPI003001ECC0